MKKILALILSVAVAFELSGQKANPSFRSFHPDDFGTNSYVITSIGTSSTSWLPGVGYESWHENFSGGDISTTAATIGQLGWTEVADNGAVGLTNEVNHWGCVALLTTANAGSQQTIFNSDTFATISTIPPLNATVGWTNRIIWRVNVTNSIKAHLALIGTTATFGQAALQSSIGVYINSTNSTQIMGMVSHASTLSTTNLETMVNAEWHTNYIWCNTSGVISFSIDGGPEATLNSNIPTSGLQPAFSIIKTETLGGISTLQVDEWTIWWKRL